MRRSGEKPALLIVSTSDAIYETLKTMGDTYYQLYTVRGIVILDKDMIGKQIKGIPGRSVRKHRHRVCLQGLGG